MRSSVCKLGHYPHLLRLKQTIRHITIQRVQGTTYHVILFTISRKIDYVIWYFYHCLFIMRKDIHRYYSTQISLKLIVVVQR